MEHQDGQDRGMLHAELTGAILHCAFEVVNELGSGFIESVYQNAMMLALRQRGLAVKAEHPIKVAFRGECVGCFNADLFVEGKVIVELKAVNAIAPEHQAQVINYLKATGVEVGLLINFGNPRLEYKRLYRALEWKLD